MTFQEAKTELVSQGYLDLHAPPGSPQVWLHPKTRQRRVIMQVDRTTWQIVDYDLDWLE